MSEFQGVIVAAVTPRGKHGDVDFGAAFELVDHCGRGGAKGILLFGEEGEYPAFSADERSRLAYLAVKRSRVPVYVGAGSPDLETTLGLAREAAEAGASAILVPPPFFQRCDADDIAEFYAQLARQLGSGITYLLYNTPLTTSEIPLDTVLSLLRTGCFGGINDASGDPDLLARLQAFAGAESFEVLAGNDRLILEALSAGCAVVSALGCAVPELVTALDRAIRAAAQSEVMRLTALFRELSDWACRFPPQVVVKTALGLRGLKTGTLPVPLSSGKQRMLDQFREWFKSWLPAVKRLSANA